MSGDNQAYAAAELGTALRGENPGEAVNSWAGLIDDEQTVRLLNHYDSLLDEPIEETQIGQRIISNAATDTTDRAVRNGSVSQMKAVTGLTGQSDDGRDLYGKAARRLGHEGAIGIVFGSPGSGKTTTTLDIARSWRSRSGGRVIGNTSYAGFDAQFTSDTEMLEQMASFQGPVLAIIDEVAQELSGYGDSSKQAENFSNSLLLIRKAQERFGEYAKKGSVLLVGHTRMKVAKSIRRVASFGIEKPHGGQPDKARLLDSEGGKDKWSEVAAFQGLTDTPDNYAEYEVSEFAVEQSTDTGEEQTLDLDRAKKQAAIETVVRAKVHQGLTYDEIAGNDDDAGLVDYSAYWVGEKYREWKNGSHDFVDVDRSVIE